MPGKKWPQKRGAEQEGRDAASDAPVFFLPFCVCQRKETLFFTREESGNGENASDVDVEELAEGEDLFSGTA